MVDGFVNFTNVIDEFYQGVAMSVIIHVVMQIDMEVLLCFSECIVAEPGRQMFEALCYESF